MPRSILMPPGLKIPIESEKIANLWNNQIFKNFDFQKTGGDIMKKSETCIIFREESDFDQPGVPK